MRLANGPARVSTSYTTHSLNSNRTLTMQTAYPISKTQYAYLVNADRVVAKATDERTALFNIILAAHDLSGGNVVGLQNTGTEDAPSYAIVVDDGAPETGSGEATLTATSGDGPE